MSFLSSLEDYENDDEIGFQRIEAREIDTLGRGMSAISSSNVARFSSARCGRDHQKDP